MSKPRLALRCVGLFVTGALFAFHAGQGVAWKIAVDLFFAGWLSVTLIWDVAELKAKLAATGR